MLVVLGVLLLCMCWCDGLMFVVVVLCVVCCVVCVFVIA